MNLPQNYKGSTEASSICAISDALSAGETRPWPVICISLYCAAITTRRQVVYSCALVFVYCGEAVASSEMPNYRDDTTLQAAASARF